jgi:hypothetical protein
MKTTESDCVSAESINYDDTPIAELELDCVEYRLDADRGSAVAVSRRDVGTWTWRPVTLGRWDGRHLRARGLDDQVLSALGQSLSAALRELEDG